MVVNSKVIAVWSIGLGAFVVSQILKDPPLQSMGEWFVSLFFYLCFFHWVASYLLGQTMFTPYGGEHLKQGSNPLLRFLVFMMSFIICSIVIVQ